MKELNVITKGKAQAQGKSVLLFSGGMDSVMFNLLLKPDVLLYIPTGSNYETVETAKIQKMAQAGIIDKDKLVVLDKELNLGMFERDDLIVPNRNAHLILLASHFGETIYLGSVYGDRSFDKDKTFYTLMENLLNHMWAEQHWTEERKFTVTSPYKDTTKTELIKEYVKEGGNIQHVLDSYSCYRGWEQPCGICKPCVRKAVSLYCNDIKVPNNYFEEHPMSAAWIKEVLPLMADGKYRGREDSEFLLAMDKTGFMPDGS
jgi:7-cyano-7-deazaguanine synthase in queuosine biosynthesis